MSDNLRPSGAHSEDVASGGPDPTWGAGTQDRAQTPITPGVVEETMDQVEEPPVDRYAIPEPDQIVPTYVRNEAPWVGIPGEAANLDPSVLADAPSVPSEEPEFTRIVRARQRGKEAIAWMVTGGFIVTAAWFLPILLVPTSPLGRVGSFATLSVGGGVAVVTLLQTWRWAHRAV